MHLSNFINRIGKLAINDLKNFDKSELFFSLNFPSNVIDIKKLENHYEEIEELKLDKVPQADPFLFKI